MRPERDRDPARAGRRQDEVLRIHGVRCPFFEEVLVAFCRAYPVKKMVPSDRLQTECVCTREGFDDCALFREVMARLEGTRAGGGGARPPGPADLTPVSD